MGKIKGKQRQDKFYYLAKEQGYRSRAAFKLLQLDAKYRFLPSARSILDLCAAPGGWLQVAVRHAPVGSFVIGVDLFPIRPVRGAHALVEDITTPRCRAAIKRLMDSNGCSAFDVVLHDGSPNVGGAWAQEATSQSALVVDSVRLATNFLAPKGTFVTKGKKELSAIDSAEPDDEYSKGDAANSEDETQTAMLHDDSYSEMDSDEEQKRWFSQDVFTEAPTDDALEKSDSEDEKEEKFVKVPAKSKGNMKQSKDLTLPISKKPEEDDFEIVPAERMETSDDSSSSSDESEEMDDDTKAEILAYAKKMLRKKQREQILDDAYNKYMFDDEGLPKWFADEEKQHCQPMKPITREEVAAMRAQFREIDARPAKKVAEAKARKKRAAMRKLEKVRQKANTIADQTDISERSKSKMIDQLYKKATPKKPKKEYVVAKKGVRMKVGKGKVLVDPRMKKDARSRGMGRPGKGKGKGGLKKGKGANGKKGQKAKQSAKSPGKGVGKGRKKG
ncbi:hypothetical protein B296_00026334 [Ensete ventricosum]|uniref:rRNA methyltransferase n=1 Tax=Ensete ventricosum TaxID=4639 RepID=A0A427ARX9_ENSVE|nr:hypothetical protein B296_00026334 [Ensete ventricosum]